MGTTIYKGVKIPADLVGRATEKAGEIQRVAFTKATEEWLPKAVGLMLEAGASPSYDPQYRRRSFDPETWQALGRAEKITGQSKIELLRCCLRLLVTENDKTLDVEKVRGALFGGEQAFLELMGELGRSLDDRDEFEGEPPTKPFDPS